MGLGAQTAQRDARARPAVMRSAMLVTTRAAAALAALAAAVVMAAPAHAWVSVKTANASGGDLALAAAVVMAAPAHAQQDPAIVITEFMASNGSVVVDDDGDYSDWIEIHNRSNSTVELAGYRLVAGDDVWLFPATNLAAGDYLIVWASAKDHSGDLHTNFKLAAAGERLALTDPAGAVLTGFEPVYPPQHLDISWGLGGDGLWGPMSPTPGRANGGVTNGKASAPTAATGRGIYSSAITERLSTTTPGATIRYTTNGRPVNDTSAVAPAAITVSPSSTGIVTIRARAYAPNMVPSPEVSWSYVFPTALYPSNPATHAGFSSRPVVVVNTEDLANPTGTRKQARIEMIDPNGPGFSVPVGTEKVGETSTSFTKANYRLYFDSEWGQQELDYPLFGDFGRGTIEPTETFRRLNLRGFSYDGVGAGHLLTNPTYTPLIGYYVSDQFWKNLILDAGQPAPHGRYVSLFLNGRFWGAYHLKERFDHHFGESYGRGESQDYESTKIYALGGTKKITNGDGSVADAVYGARDWPSVRDQVDAGSLINAIFSESIVSYLWEAEFRTIAPMDPAAPGGMWWITNDNDFELYRLTENDGRLWGSILHAVGYDFDDDPEYRQHLYYYAAKAFCPGGPFRAAAMRARLEELVDELEPIMRAEEARWGYNAYNLWQRRMNTARANIAAHDTTLFNGLTASGDLRGCDLRPTVNFADNRLSATGVTVAVAVKATDPDDDAITFTSASLPPGLSLNSTTGEVTGTPTTPGSFDVQIRVEDSRGKWLLHDVKWTVTGSAQAAVLPDPRLVLNEYNAVSASGTDWTGSDPVFGSGGDNGGDWLELLVVESGLDIRGWSVELWDRDRSTDSLEQTDVFTFADHAALADLAAGTIVTISERVGDDDQVDLGSGDWHINANSSDSLTGSLLTSASRSNFDTNRHDLHVVIRDAEGNPAAPMAGETDEWDEVNENVSAGEVMALCGDSLGADPVADYSDEGANSTFGAANICAGQVQNLEALRGGTGDADCDGDVDHHDVRLVLGFVVGRTADAGPCRSGVVHQGMDLLSAPGANIVLDATTGLTDAHFMAQCIAGTRTQGC